jgi:superfamily II DNA or RNA helicase
MFTTIRKNDYTITNDLLPFVIFENENYYYFPRYIKTYINHPNLINFIDSKFVPSDVRSFEMLTSPRDYQIPIIDTVLEYYKNNGYISGIIKARPGYGKTFSAIYISCQLNKKTLVVIDIKKIAEQWKDAILEHTNLTENDIGLIKGNIFDVEDKTFIITTPQTLSSKVKRNFKDAYLLFRDIGIDMVIIDEAHKMGNVWASASLLYQTNNVIGLSATPYNEKDKDILIRSIVGDIMVEYGEYDFHPTIKYVQYNSGLGATYGKRVNWLWNTRFEQGRSVYNSKLTESTAWINTICSIVKADILPDNNNRMIIICTTQQQLLFIHDALSVIGIDSVKLYSKENTIDKNVDRVIVATYKYASHAFDYKELNRLILAIPLMGKKSLIQSIGRIVRSSLNKSDAIVYDMIDIDSGFNGIFKKTIDSKTKILQTEFDTATFENITVSI